MDAVNMSWILSAKAIPRSLPLVFSSRAKQNQRYTGVRLDSHESTRATNSSKDTHRLKRENVRGNLVPEDYNVRCDTADDVFVVNSENPPHYNPNNSV